MNEDLLSRVQDEPEDHLAALLKKVAYHADALSDLFADLPPYIYLNHPKRKKLAEAGERLAGGLQETRQSHRPHSSLSALLRDEPDDHLGALLKKAAYHADALSELFADFLPYFCLNHPQRKKLAAAGERLAGILQEARQTHCRPLSRRVRDLPLDAPTVDGFADPLHSG